MKKIVYLGRKWNKDLAYFRIAGRENRLALSESTLKFLITHPSSMKLGPADIAELKLGLRGFQIL
ncbi:MAG: hypothetical protein AAF694_11305 [Bacteroidota bacterium]